MPKITLKPTLASDAAIAADAARIYLEMRGSADCRFSFGATYVEADSQQLGIGDTRVFEGTPAQQAFSFGTGKNTIIDVSFF